MALEQITVELANLRDKLSGWQPSGKDEAFYRFLMDDFLETLDHRVTNVITESNARRAQETQMETALCFAEDALAVITPDGEIRMVNPAAERMTGYAGMQLIGLSVFTLLPEPPEGAPEGLKKAIIDKKPWRGELTCLTAHGDNLECEITLGPVTDHQGLIQHFVLLIRDISERKRMEKEISLRKNFLEKVINLTSNIIIVLDDTGRFRMDNLQAKTLISDLGDNARENLSRLLLKETEGGVHIKNRKLTVPFPSGRTDTYLMNAERVPGDYLFPDSPGHVYIVTLSDITLVEEQNKEILARQKAMLTAKAERSLLREEFAGGLVYRLQSPVNMLKASCNLLTAGLPEDTDNSRNALARIKEQLTAIEKELTSFTRRSLPPEEESGTADAADALETMRILYADRLEAEGVTLNVSIKENPRLPLDDGLVQMLFIILMDNALDSMADTEEKQITVRARTNGRLTTVTVDDSGPGVAEQDRLKIFEPFYTTKQGHDGLSLAMLHQVMRRAGGGAEVEASPLGGARFRLTFPLNGD